MVSITDQFVYVFVYYPPTESNVVTADGFFHLISRVHTSICVLVIVSLCMYMFPRLIPHWATRLLQLPPLSTHLQ